MDLGRWISASGSRDPSVAFRDVHRTHTWYDSVHFTPDNGEKPVAAREILRLTRPWHPGAAVLQSRLSPDDTV